MSFLFNARRPAETVQPEQRGGGRKSAAASAAASDPGGVSREKEGDRQRARHRTETAAGLQGQQPLVEQDNVGKGSRLKGWVTLGEPLALRASRRLRTVTDRENPTV